MRLGPTLGKVRDSIASSVAWRKYGYTGRETFNAESHMITIVLILIKYISEASNRLSCSWVHKCIIAGLFVELYHFSC